MSIFEVERFEDAMRIGGLSRRELAERVRVTPSRLSQFGDRPPPPDLVQAMAAELKVRPEFFYLSPLPTAMEPFWRRVTKTPAQVRERYRRLAQLFGEAMRLGGIRPKGLLPNHSDLDPVAAATALRADLGLQPDEALASTVALLEAQGVAVHELDIADDELVDAFCTWIDGIPLVFLNPVKADPYRARHNGGHELRHLTSHDSPLEGEGKKSQEDDANRFASELLLPTRTWRELAPRRGLTNPWTYLDAKATYGVSVKSLIWKTRAAGLMDDSEYRYALMRYSAMGWNSGEPEPDRDMTDVHDRPTTARRILSSFGSASALAEALQVSPELAASIFGAVPPPRSGLRVIK